ncbi:MAG: hypothetical protein V3R60_02305 [Acidobacteriota bacterium]
MNFPVLLHWKDLRWVVMALLLATFACSSNFQSGEVKTQRASTAQSRKNVAQAGGISWAAPDGWTQGPERPMRAATYRISAAAGDSEDAECAVFYFGVGQGGTVQANIDRWFSQFEQPDGQPSSKVAKVAEQIINGLKVTTVSLAGSYLASRGPMAHRATAKPGFHMRSAIVDAPQGPVFFKLTGPSETVLGIREEFEGFLQTLKRN